jgi:hypothetical protein
MDAHPAVGRDDLDAGLLQGIRPSVPVSEDDGALGVVGEEEPRVCSTDAQDSSSA